jgi:hypothetical protein
MRPPSKTIDVTGAPIDVIPGESIAHITLGMKRADVETLGIHLTPETTPRVDRKGWLAGPLLVLVDPADRVVLVSVELRASRGLRVAGRAVPNTATLAQIASLVPGCTRGSGSGGDFVAATALRTSASRSTRRSCAEGARSAHRGEVALTGEARDAPTAPTVPVRRSS